VTDDPLFSVIIDNYNYGEFLEACIDSALGQTCTKLEVIVVDDGSSDSSREIIGAYGPRIHAILQPNSGQAAAFSAGVAVARGAYIGFLDADDVWHRTKVETVLAAFAAHPRARWLRHRLEVTDAALRPTGTPVPRIRTARLARPDPYAFAEGCVMAPSSAIVLDRRLVERVFPLPLPAPGSAVDMRYDADAFILQRAASTGAPFLSIPDVLGYYRRHDRQRYFAVPDMLPQLERQIEVAIGASELMQRRPPSTVYKHRVVVAALRGTPLLHRERLGTALQGMQRVAALALVRPRLGARQAAALALATIAPRYWVRRLIRQQAFAREPANG
jgi:hypothetical protein